MIPSPQVDPEVELLKILNKKLYKLLWLKPGDNRKKIKIIQSLLVDSYIIRTVKNMILSLLVDPGGEIFN